MRELTGVYVLSTYTTLHTSPCGNLSPDSDSYVTWSVLGPAQLRKANAIFIIKIVYFFGICSKIGN